MSAQLETAQRASVARRRWWKYALISLPFVLACIVAAVYLFSLSVNAASAIAKYDSGDYAGSEADSTRQLDLNLVEKYLPYFNRGDALAADQQYTRAIDDFERALELAPEERKCDVRVNLSLSWELLGDIYEQGGFHEGAVLLYQAAQAVIEEGGEACTPPTQELLDTAEIRIQEKIEQSQQPDGDEEVPDGDDEKLDELGELGDAGAQEKANEEARQRGENGPDGGNYTKPW